MVTITANAKINLTLDILGKRSDGFHEVEMVMQEISLADIIRLERQEQGIRLAINTPGLSADRTNLAWQAAELFLRECKLNSGVNIRIEKSIPIAAGLAGGSADAAGTLRGLNELFDTGLSEAELCKLGEKLGSDVPFCICGGTMLASGRGEKLKRLPSMPDCFVILAKPKVSVSTAWAYLTYDEQGADTHPDNKAFTEALCKKDLYGTVSFMGNVLEGVACRKFKEIDEYKNLMIQNGAMAAMMSGSGPTVFALTDRKEIAERIVAALQQSVDAETIRAVKIVNRN